jgi:hypothetical protein
LQLGKVRQTSTCLSSLPARKWQPERTELCLEIWRVVVCSEWGDGKRTPHPGSPHSREPSFPSALLPSDSWATAASPHLRYLDDQNGHWAIGSSLGSWFQPGLDAECQLTKESFVDSPTPSPTHTHTRMHTHLFPVARASTSHYVRALGLHADSQSQPHSHTVSAGLPSCTQL